MKSLKIANSWFAIGMIALCTVLVAGCKNQEPDPYVVPGNTPDPNWEVTVEKRLDLFVDSYRQGVVCLVGRHTRSLYGQ